MKGPIKVADPTSPLKLDRSIDGFLHASMVFLFNFEQNIYDACRREVMLLSIG
jgi:hypothetical protein